MKITCYSCDKLMTDPGAIVLSPPIKNNKDMSVSSVHKHHICLKCWEMLIKYMDSLDKENK